jgi:hypothetical protein
MAGSEHGHSDRIWLHHGQCRLPRDFHAGLDWTRTFLGPPELPGVGIQVLKDLRDHHGFIIASLLDFGCEFFPLDIKGNLALDAN